MVSCDPVTLEKVRAELWLGDSQLIARTPFVKSFNVQKSRGQLSDTFSATAIVKADIKFQLGESFVVKAGTKGNLKKKFTGEITSTQVNPAFGMPGYVSINFSGRGIMSDLENKKFSRRLSSTGQGLYCTIKSGATNRPEKFYSLDKTIQAGNQKLVSPTVVPGKEFGGENSPLVVHNSSQRGEPSSVGDPVAIASDTTGGGKDPDRGGSFKEHDHSDIDEGGPAYGVFSAD